MSLRPGPRRGHDARRGWFDLGHWYVRAFSCVVCIDSCSVVGKDRRENGEFIGAEGVRKHLKEGPPRRRVGLTVEGAPARRECYVPPTCASSLTMSFRGSEDLRAVQ